MAVVKVTYKGFSDIRILPAKDLGDHGVTVDRDLTFYRRPQDGVDHVFIDMSPKLEAILRADGGFRISAVNDNGADGSEVVSATDEVEPGTVVIEDETGKTKG